MPRRDFIFTNNLMERFCKSRHVRKTLRVINDNELSGWEKWMQIEFSSFLAEHPEIAEWYREESFPLDKRKDKFKKRGINRA